MTYKHADMHKLLAKSLKLSGKPVYLVEHSLEVAQRCLTLADAIGVSDKHLRVSAYLSGLLHDVGKAARSIQDFFGGDKEDEAPTPNTLYHHEISWGVVSQVLPASCLKSSSSTPPFPNDLKDSLLTAIYWHHAQPSRMDTDAGYVPLRGKTGDICMAGQEDFHRVHELAKLLLSHPDTPAELGWAQEVWIKEAMAPEAVTPRSSDKVPDLVMACSNNRHTEILCINAVSMLLRALLIRADREVSSGAAFGTFAGLGVVHDMPLPAGFDGTRWDMQRKVVDRIAKEWEASSSPVVINAPGGFGKTSIGLLSAMRVGGRVLWVCPRNEVASSVYHNILSELGNFGDTSTTVELFLGSRVVCRSPGNQENPFESSIVVTNVDNLLKGTCDNDSSAVNVYSALDRTVVFDEYHEFLRTGGLFYVFAMLLLARAEFCRGSRTLLLSATGNAFPIEDLLGLTNPPAYLPGRYEHMPPAHEKPYRVSLIDSPSRIRLNPGDVAIFNSVHNTQVLLRRGEADIVAHGSFAKEDRESLMDALDRMFGKKGSSSQLPRVSAAMILQAAKDISFLRMTESINSPESTMQRLGRLNRWGRQDSAEFSVLLPFRESPGHFSWSSESSGSSMQASRELTGLWSQFLKKAVRGGCATMTLREMYGLYNKFSSEHEEVLRNEALGLLIASSEQAAKVRPLRLAHRGSTRKDGAVSSARGTLRSVEASFYFAPKNSCGRYGCAGGGDGVVLSIQDSYLQELFEKDAWTWKGIADLCKQLKVQKAFPELVEELESLSKGKRKGSEDSLVSARVWRNLARSENMPYPSRTWVYDKVEDTRARSEGRVGPGLVKSPS